VGAAAVDGVIRILDLGEQQLPLTVSTAFIAPFASSDVAAAATNFI